MKKLSVLKKSLSVFAGAVLLAGSLAACGSDSPSPSAGGNTGGSAVENTGAGGDTVTIRVCWWGNQTRNDNTVAALDLYSELNPNIEFEVEFSDWDGYWDKLATQAASGNLADIIQMDYAYLKQYVESGQLAGMDEYIENGIFDTANIPDSILESGMVDDVLYAICSGMNCKALLVRTDIMEECGVTLPMQPTWEEFFEAAAVIYEKTGMQIEIPSNDEQTMLFLARAVGETMFNEAGDALGMADKTVALRYYTMLEETLDMGIHIAPELMAEASTNQQGLFESGKVWCGLANSNQITNTIAQSEDGIEFGILMFPTEANATQQTLFLKPSMFFAVAETSQNKEEAMRVIDFLTNSTEANEELMGERGVPISNAVSDHIKPMLDDVTATVTAYVEQVAEVATPIDPAFPAASAEVGSLISDLADMVRYREISPEDAAERFYTGATEILAKGAS